MLERTIHLPLFNDPAPGEIYTLSLHDALPICASAERIAERTFGAATALLAVSDEVAEYLERYPAARGKVDRKSTRLNSSHVAISYAVFCLKKKRTPPHTPTSSPAPRPCTSPHS